MIGYSSGGAVTTGTSNTCIGYQAGNVLASGASNNIAIGVNSVTAGSNASHNYGIGVSVTTLNENNQFTFGNDSLGVVHNNFDTNASWTRTSDERIKTNITDDNLGLSFINQLRPVTFNWKPNNELPKHFRDYAEENVKDTDRVLHGMLAQEVKASIRQRRYKYFWGLERRCKDTGQQYLSQEMFVYPPYPKAVKELSAEVQELKKQLENK